MADDPNQRTDATYLVGLTSVADTDDFLSRFNHENNYCDGTTKLHVGDTIGISDGAYNCYWRIAGFDLEYSRIASDNTTYDNGYGIMLYPSFFNINGYWNSDNTVSGGYKSSLAHSKAVEIATNMKNSILGSHLVNRNVLLSSSVNGSGQSSAATWTTAYGTLPSVGQFFCLYRYSTGYDDGEANYKLPLFNYHYMAVGYDRWFRNINIKTNSDYNVWYLQSDGEIMNIVRANYSSKYYYPLLYIR